MRKNILLIFGGESGEHEVSRISASSVIKNLNKALYNIYTVAITKEGKWLYFYGDENNIISEDWLLYTDNSISVKLIPVGNHVQGIELPNGVTVSVDAILPILHGPNGEDGTIQGLFELSKIPYVGCNVLASAVAMDKIICSKILESENISQVPYTYTTKYEFLNNSNQELDRIISILDYPIFVKPANLGSSVGISKVKNDNELLKGILEALKYDTRVILEQGFDVREVEVAVLGNENPIASIVGEIIPDKDFYDYEDKYINGASQLQIPALLTEDVSDSIRTMAIKAFKAINGSGLSRVDFFIDKNTNNIYLNEINTLPGFTNISMYPKLWENSGISYSDLLTKLIDLAIENKQ